MQIFRESGTTLAKSSQIEGRGEESAQRSNATKAESPVNPLARNLRLLCVFRAVQMGMLPIAIVPLYWRDELGLNMTEIFVLQALFGLFVACFEFPGGFIADRIGYRSALGWATGFSAMGWIVLGGAESFASALAGEAFLAVSLALSSGTDSALLYESCVELGEEESFGRWFGRSRSIGAAAEGTAALAAGLLYSIWAPLPFYLQALLWGINALVVLALVEPARHPPSSDHAWKQAREIFVFAMWRSPRLRASIAAVTLMGLSTFAPVWMVAIYAEKSGISPAWIGPIWAAANYTVALGLGASNHATKRLGVFPTLAASVALITLGLAGMGASHAIWGVAFYFAVCLGRGLHGPVLNHLQQRLIPSRDRASLLSINSLLFRLAFVGLGPLLGMGIDKFGEHLILWVVAAVSLPLSAGSLAWLWRTGAGQPPGEATPAPR